MSRLLRNLRLITAFSSAPLPVPFLSQLDSLNFPTPHILKMHIILFIYCNWVVTRWQWLFNTNTKHEIGLLLNLRREGYMRGM
jgi:hypothetical protein